MIVFTQKNFLVIYRIERIVNGREKEKVDSKKQNTVVVNFKLPFSQTELKI